jgi:hypothetical protein
MADCPRRLQPITADVLKECGFTRVGYWYGRQVWLLTSDYYEFQWMAAMVRVEDAVEGEYGMVDVHLSNHAPTDLEDATPAYVGCLPDLRSLPQWYQWPPGASTVGELNALVNLWMGGEADE